MTNLPSTLQRVLAEFEKSGWTKMCRYEDDGSDDVMIDLETAKKGVEKAVIESLKEAFAATESDVDIKAVIRWNIDRAEDIIDDARDERFDPKDHAMTGGIRSVAGGIKSSLENILAALQAIEAKKAEYFRGQQ